jgi:hypothetical protein
MAQQTTADVEQDRAAAPKDEALPLPKWLTKIYYIFPIVLYVPDMLFNFYVYSDGSGLDTSKFTLANLPGFLLWGFLAAGIVGMAWLCSVLAPWHWIKGNKFQSVMCWIGVIIATSITIWNSLAYRSQTFKAYATDSWVNAASKSNGFSLTMVLVSCAPPFWGLFWAIVQPAVGKKSLAEEQESHAMKIERMKQEAEYKRLRAEANAGVRAAQLKGLAATVRSARAQMAGKPEDGATETTDDTAATPAVAEPFASDRVVSLPAASIRRLSERRPQWGEESESGEHEVVRASAASMAYSVGAAPRDDVFEAPSGEFNARPLQGTLLHNNPPTGEHETMLSTSRPGLPRASTLLRNYADGEHVMRAVDADVERMRTQGMKVTIKSFAEFRGIELSLAKQLLAKWREWKQGQMPARAENLAE